MGAAALRQGAGWGEKLSSFVWKTKKKIMLVTIAIILLCSVVAIAALYFKVKSLEARTLDISISDIVVFSSRLQDLLSEGERVAERLDRAIQDREAVLEDLGDLLDARISRLNELSENKEPDELIVQVKKLLKQGRTKQEISRLLNMSLTEIDLLSTVIKS